MTNKTKSYKIIQWNTGKYGVKVNDEKHGDLFLVPKTSLEGVICLSGIGCFKKFNQDIQLETIEDCKILVEEHKQQIKDSILFVENEIEELDATEDSIVNTDLSKEHEQETIQAWALKFSEGLSVQHIFRTRKEARELSKELEEDFGDTSKVVKVQIQALN